MNASDEVHVVEQPMFLESPTPAAVLTGVGCALQTYEDCGYFSCSGIILTTFFPPIYNLFKHVLECNSLNS